MAQDIIVPEVGESISSGILAAWLKQDGESVSTGDELFELETDKATLAVPSPGDGVLKVSISEGSEVEVGQVVGSISSDTATSGDSSAGAQNGAAGYQQLSAPQAARQKPAAPPQAAPTPAAPQPQAPQPEPPQQSAPSPRDTAVSLEELSPAVRRVVTEHGLDPGAIRGTGPGGRITKEDALRAAGEASAGKAAPSQAGSASGAAAGADSGSGGQPSLAQPSMTAGERQEIVAMTSLRKRVAERLVASQAEAAQLTTFNEVDMSGVMSLRSAHKEGFEKKYGTRLGFMSFFVKASVLALQKYPQVNAYVDATNIVYNHFYDISVAVSTDRGLLTPVLRDADRMSFARIESAITDFSTRAQNKRILPNELMGGTFTISNGGIFGSMLSTPIPNPPQTAVLGMHSIQQRPVVRDGQIVARPMMYLALTYDHRILDGRDAIGFLVTIKEAIEDPASMLFEL